MSEKSNFYGWKELILLDDDFNVKRFLIRRTSMKKKDDLCFCGNGKKYSECHYNIAEDSVIANLYSVNHQLDLELKTSEFTVCQRGCTDCCSDFFNVSCQEFFYILQYIINDIEKVKSVSSISRQILKNLYIPEDDTYNIPNFPPCIFLNGSSGDCAIYEVRPIICKLYGKAKILTKCPKVLQNEKALLNLIDIKNSKIEIGKNIDYFEIGEQLIQPRMHPLVYWFAKLDENGRLANRKMSTLFAA